MLDDRDNKLAQFKRRKDKGSTMSGNSTPSDTSLSLGADLLPENKRESDGDISVASSISEHISNENSEVENDRSFQEIEISQILKSDETNISQENQPSLNSSSESAAKNAKSILEEILRDDQFKSDTFKSDSVDGSLNIFEGVNLDDNSINNYVLRLKSNEASLDDRTLNYDNRNISLIRGDELGKVDSPKELTSNQSTFSFNTTLTDYKQYQEECSNKIFEYESALTHRDRIIEELTESLQELLAKQQEWCAGTEVYTLEIQQLQSQLADAASFIKNHKCEAPYDSLDEKHVSERSEKSIERNVSLFDDVCSSFQNTLDSKQNSAFIDLRSKMDEYMARQMDDFKEGEMKILQDKMQAEKIENLAEIERLKELLDKVRVTEIEEVKKELNSSYLKEMEELRTYYEKKCADMEKHYSDEVFSQQSRKMSGSSTGSEPEFASDLIYGSAAHPNGPGGDSVPAILPKQSHHSNFTKHDLIALKTAIDAFNELLTKYELNNLSDSDFDELKTALFDMDLKKLLKLDLTLIKNDLQSKYNVELEVLHNDHDNRVDLIKMESEDKLREIEDEYKQQLEALRIELENTNIQRSSAVQESANSDEYELADIVKSYQIKLEAQVAIAKIDILTMLENQMQMVASNPCDDDLWPDELIRIRNCFTEKYEKEIADLNAKHEEEITKLKEEHMKTLNGALERARRRSLRDSEAFADLEVIKERNSLKKSTTALRKLIQELLKYVGQCEDELNTTLIEELVKCGVVESDQNLNETSTSSSSISLSKRVHLTPNLSDYLNKFEGSSFDSKDVSVEYQSELETCLERLKAEANAVFALTVNMKDKDDNDDRAKSLEERIGSLTRRLISDSQIKEDLSVQLTEAREFARNIEIDRNNLEKHSEQLLVRNRMLEGDLAKARDKISELVENGRKEIVSEGYGETDKIGLQRGTVERTSLSELQERARMLAAETSSSTETPLLLLVEELCREGDRLVDDAKKDREDYIKQIEVADKKLRATTAFLEEQAIDREQERDESQKEITSLKEQLKEREKDKTSYERITRESGDLSAKMNTCCRFVHEDIVSTVEQLENQMRDMSKLMSEGEQRFTDIDIERKEAVDKIYVLRGIISDLENQLMLKKQSETELQDLIEKLKDVISQQREANDELTTQIETGTHSVGLREHILRLEEEVNKLRLTNELAGNEGVLKQIQLQLHEIELSIDKGTSDLENSHSIISSTSCSSPSEEMSIRDQIRPQTPSSTLDECEIPLQQLARLKEKLIKHSRAENAAIKKIRDLEMQLISTKHELDEVQNEKEVLQDQVSEQLVLISSLQIRLDDQRIRAEHNQKQTNASLESKIYDLETEIQNMRDTLHMKENVIKQLNKSLEQTKLLLQTREKELSSSSDDGIIRDMQLEINRLKSENDIFRVKIESDAQNAQLLPSLVDNILADKNRDIDTLRNKLSETERQLELYLSISVEKGSLKKAEERGALSFINLSSPDALRKSESRASSLELSDDPAFKHKARFEPEISCIEHVGSPNIHYTLDAPLMKPNSTERSVEKHVHFKDTSTDEVKDLKDQVMHAKERIAQLEENAKEIESLQLGLKTEQEEMQKLRLELAEVKMHLMEKEKSCELLQEDGKRKDDMYYNLAKEKHDLEKASVDLNELKIKYASLQAELESASSQYTEKVDKELILVKDLNDKKAEVLERDQIISKLEKEVGNKSKQLKVVSDEMMQMKEVFEAKLIELQKQFEMKEREFEENKNSIVEIERLKTLLVDRECELEILNEDINRYQSEISSLETQLKTNTGKGDQLKLMKQRKEVAEKDLEIVKLKTRMSDLNKEIIHLQDYLVEKDKIIDQMKVDAENLRITLEVIRAKMAETGNVVDLREKLIEEKQKNAALRSELLEHGNEMVTSIDEISEQVQKQLDYSAHLDDSILNAISSGDFANISDIEILRTAINKERLRNEELKQKHIQLESQLKDSSENLSKAIETIRELKIAIEGERKICKEIQVEDANLLEQMRIKLEAALENENEFEAVLQEEKRMRVNLEAEIAALRRKKTENLSSTSSKTEYKSLPDVELTKLKMDLQALIDENQRLKKDFKNLKKAKLEADAGLKYTKDILNLKCKEVEELEKRQIDFAQELVQAKESNEDIRQQLEQKLREIENTRVLIDELEQEKLEIRTEAKRLQEHIKILENEPIKERQNPDLSAPVPEKFLQKMKDLGDLVTENLKENKTMSETIAKLTDERKLLQERIRNLEEQNDVKMPFDDPVARANHLFGKYLRENSYKNALAWQKKYLIRLLATYQNHDSILGHNVITFNAKNRRVRDLKGVRKFRSIATVLIAIIRMKYMVQRWHSGTRGSAYNMHRKLRHIQTDQHLAANFHVGQPVSSQHFNVLTPSRLHGGHTEAAHSRLSAYEGPKNMTPPRPEGLMPWSGYTPPSKEKRSSHMYERNTPSTSTSNLVPLQVPDLSQFVERFNSIQQTLALALDRQQT